mmetsp:Transcript_25013/g.29386  ORF Transcript_25013/g.29386 Transcript_25013/m.29386 type:complete len:104 (+) Transcript_25013:854-1165(+)
MVLRLLIVLLSLVSMTLAQAWERAELVLKDMDAVTDQDMKDFLSSQPQLKRIIEADAATPRLQMYREGATDPTETLFIAHVPAGMVKNILKEKGLLNVGYDDL